MRDDSCLHSSKLRRLGSILARMKDHPFQYSGPDPIIYDTYLGPVLFEHYGQLIKEKLAPFEPQHILELACGTGRLTNQLIQLSLLEALIATDVDEHHLKFASRKLYDDRLCFALSDAQQLPYGEESFDALVCGFGWMFFENRAQAAKEAYRVLRKGGRLIFSTWVKAHYQPRIFALHEVLREVLGTKAPDFEKKGPFSLHDENLLQSFLKDAGFQSINISRECHTSSFTSESDLVKGFLEGSDLGGFLLKKHPEHYRTVEEKLIDRLQTQSKTLGKNYPMQALIIQAEKPGS